MESNLTEKKVDFVQDKIISGYNYRKILENYLTTFKDSNAIELKNEIIPIVQENFIIESRNLESIKETERLKAVKRLSIQIANMQELITEEIVSFRQAKRDYGKLFLEGGKQVSTSNITKLVTSFINLQDKINKLLGLEEISINLIKNSLTKIPSLSDADLYSDMKKILTIRGYLEQGGNTEQEQTLEDDAK